MGKWLFCISILPALLLAANGAPQGNSLYGSQSQQGQIADCSHLSYEEQMFAANLSTIHRNVFCSQFSPAQRSSTMALVKMKDPLNTTPGNITPDHAVEIIMQSSRNNGTGQSTMPGQNQQMPQQYQPYNQQQNPNNGQQNPYGSQNMAPQTPSGPQSNQCRPY
ncbi:MAG: hypothetical protein KDK44_00550 [Chlamydiia bacterium]|nr:hypothetical protein [Chlamydiia bacterium]MCP5509574.1 hypothetical protein [Chlamydiales bacterium]HPE85594.1 hypothetical protein [Chlamydiales bacterium]